MKIAILGYGVVGSGVAEVLCKDPESIKRKAGEVIEVAHILDRRKFPESPYNHIITDDFNKILNDPEVTLAAEVMGGCEPAYTFTKQLLLAGKHVVTSNKELVAKHGTELLALAKEKNLNYMFEASVGGGIPIIRPLNSCLAANELTEIIGILNGTTNYILTQMIKNGETFDDALKAAQEKGYAESDPSADVDGIDTCRKTAILASLAFGKFVDSENILTEGITQITLADVEYANKIGCSIKLLGWTKKDGDAVYARVCPALIPADHPLSGIEDVFNGILIKGDAIGDVMFYGRGAGKLPTASAVVADIIDIAKHKNQNTRLMWTDSDSNYLLDCKNVALNCYVRIKTSDRRECMNHINSIVNDCDFIVLEKPEYAGEMAIILKKMSEYDVDICIKKISALDCVDSVLGKIRMMEE